MSSIIFSGNLTSAPEFRRTTTRRAVARFTVAVKRRRKTETRWEPVGPVEFRIEVWNRLAENIAASLHVGDRVHIEGNVVTRPDDRPEEGISQATPLVLAREVFFSLRHHSITATKNDELLPADDTAIIGSWHEAKAAEIAPATEAAPPAPISPSRGRSTPALQH